MLALAGMLCAAAFVAAEPPPAAAQGDEKKVLIYTGTTGYRHAGGSQAIGQAAIDAIQGRLSEVGIESDWEDCNGRGTDAGQCHHPDKNPRIFTEANLAQYDAIFLFNASDYWSGTGGQPGQLWDAEQRAAIIDFVQDGGGIAANHNATDMGAGQQTWDWWDGSPNSVVGTTMPGHSANNITATVMTQDHNHLSTRDLPDTWQISDEHYNWNRNVRGTHHVLANFDERTYNPGPNAMGQDHPISWCRSYDGDNVNDGTGEPKSYADGRTWITGIGHNAARYTENGADNAFMDHLIGGIRWVAGEGKKSDCGGTVWSNFSRTVLVNNANGPIGLDIARDGKVYWSEIGSQGPWPDYESEGYIKMHDPSGAPNNSTVVATIPTRADHGNSEDGVLGMALEPGFNLADPDKRDIYVYYSPRNPDWPTEGNEIEVGWNVISRFTLNAQGTSVVPGSEREILRVHKAKISGSPFGDSGPGHVGGAGLRFDSEGNLYLGVGDDVSPNAGGHNRYAPMDHRRPERWDARKTSANSADLRGKILRIKPLDNIPADAEPGLGTTYGVPEGNMFEPGTPNARPEIYAMGFRQPFTVHTDPANPGTVTVGEFCHDNASNQANRSPAGTCEWNLLHEPGFHGWPFCVGDNSPANTMTRWDYATNASTGDKYDCSLDSLPADLRYDPPGGGDDSSEPTNDGLDQIPGPAVPATIWKKYAAAGDGQDPMDFGNLEAGGMQPITGPIYRYNEGTAGPGAFPAYYDGSWFIHNRGGDNGFWKEVRLREADNEMLHVHDFLPANQFGQQIGQIIPSAFGPDGALYMARYQVGCCRNQTNPSQSTQIVRIEFNVQDECTADTQAPIVSHELAGQPHPSAPDTYVTNYSPVSLTLSASDVGCAGTDTVEYRVNGGDWQEYDGAVEFDTPGEYAVEYRATDRLENTSETGEVSFTAAEVDDTDGPELSATLSGSQDGEGHYQSSASLRITATDALSPIETIEWRASDEDEWTTEAFGDGEYDEGYTESLDVDFNEPGEYSIAYRATDAAGNTMDSSIQFTIVDVSECTPVRSDEFFGTGLDRDRWSVLDEDPERLSVNEGALHIVSAPLDIFQNQGTVLPNIVLQDLPGAGAEAWSITAEMSWNPTQNFQNAGLMIYADAGNYIKAGMVWSGGRAFELIKETNNSATFEGNSTPPAGFPERFFLRYTSEDGSTVQAQYSADGEAWTTIGSTNTSGITEPRIGVYGTASIEAGVSEPTASYHAVTITPDELICPDTTPPTTTAQLMPEPNSDGTYDAPVTITLSASDNEGGSGVAATEYRIDGGEWTNYNPLAPPTVIEPGEHTLEYRSRDNAGNEEAVRSLTFEIAGPDTGEAKLKAGVKPKRKAVKRNRKAAFRVTVRNNGDAASPALNVCAAAPKRLARIVGPKKGLRGKGKRRCQDAGPLAPKESQRLRFVVKPKPKARGKKVKIKFTAGGKGIANAKANAILRVKR